MTDEQLLIMYRKYKRKRNIIIFSIILIITISISIFIFLSISNTSSKEDEKPTEIVNIPEIKDELAPVIKLTTDSIEIIEGGDVDYLKYVESVIDDTDGDLITNIIYEEIDTSIIGEQNIMYSVSDSSGNIAQAVIVVKILQKEKPVETPKENTSSNKVETPKKEEPKPSTNNDSSNNTTAPKPETPTTNEPQNNQPQEKIVKYFLFKDGYTMLNVSEACASELKKTNRTGVCSPIQDENGIYLGMKLETN